MGICALSYERLETIMSTEQDKIKHSKRLLKDENAVKKQTKIAKSKGSNISQPHRFAKQHAMDCGNPECLLCSYAKVFGIDPVRVQRFDQDIDSVAHKRSNGLVPDNE